MSFQSIIKGWTGEQKTKLIQKLLLDGKKYRTFNSIIIQSNYGSTQIDHIIVSKYGIFVIETKNKDGWIYGRINEERWTETFYKKKYQFQNPLRQNYAHTRSLADYLKIDHSKIHSLVVFWGKCQFGTQMPPNVVKSTRIIDYINSKNQILFTDNEVDKICHELLMVKYNEPIFSGLHHARELKKRYESTTICPKCGKNLLERTSRNGKRAGEKFIGCENYPRCHYTKEL